MQYLQAVAVPVGVQVAVLTATVVARKSLPEASAHAVIQLVGAQLVTPCVAMVLAQFDAASLHALIELASTVLEEDWPLSDLLVSTRSPTHPSRDEKPKSPLSLDTGTAQVIPLP